MQKALHIGPQANGVTVQSALDDLDKIMHGPIHQMVRAQLKLCTGYYMDIRQEAQRSFMWALIAAGVGLVLFIMAVFFISIKEPANAYIATAIGGALAAFISGVNFYLYGLSASQMSDFHARLDRIQRFLLATSICESISVPEAKDAARASLMNTVACADMAKGQMYVQTLNPANSPANAALFSTSPRPASGIGTSAGPGTSASASPAPGTS